MIRLGVTIRTARRVLHAIAGGALLLAAVTHPAQGQPIAAQWLTRTSGTLNGVGFTTNAPGFSLFSTDLSGPNYAAAPLGPQQLLQYSAIDPLTITFDAPVANLRMYAAFWRGPYTGQSDPPTTYSFSQAFSLVSGFSGIVPVGNSFVAPSTSFHSGIIAFTDPVTSLTVTSTGATNRNAQGMTLGTAVATVPEPPAYLLLVSALAMLGIASRKRSA